VHKPLENVILSNIVFGLNTVYNINGSFYVETGSFRRWSKVTKQNRRSVRVSYMRIWCTRTLTIKRTNSAVTTVYTNTIQLSNTNWQ